MPLPLVVIIVAVLWFAATYDTAPPARDEVAQCDRF
jgi:hypothetical protein